MTVMIYNDKGETVLPITLIYGDCTCSVRAGWDVLGEEMQRERERERERDGERESFSTFSNFFLPISCCTGACAWT